jgi:hypothetical protein
MKWISGIRGSQIYTVEKRPLDPRWSNRDLQLTLGWCALGQHLGWNEDRAFQTAEALVMETKLHKIQWSASSLTEDMETLKSLTNPEETT